MDSKYNSLGFSGISKKFSFTLKRPSPPDKSKIKQAKKPKLQTQPSSSNKVDAPGKVAKTSTVGSVNGLKKTENFLEERSKLPVYAVRSRLLEEIKKNHTMIIIGETGSGKTTQIPQIIHEIRLEGAGAIAVTQPRRVAAITIAMRVAKEMSTNVGEIVGYSVRFEDVTSARTKLKYMTDGMLLREAMGDSLLTKYTVIILDEAHERTVSTDVLFGIVKLAQKERKEKHLQPLKVIVMSATMDVDAFSSYFNDCPVIYLEGRTHPVTIYHTKKKLDDYQHAALCTIFQLHNSTPPDHDFLVFLTGQEEIETLSYNIKQISKETKGPQIKVCPMYAGLPQGKQLEAWRPTPPGTRKVVLATNIAETSVTIPKIKCVIDSGVVKERSWCCATGAERLRVCASPRAACWQRAGRAGRDSPGRAYRLYTAADMNTEPLHQTPEILRSWCCATGAERLRVCASPRAACWQRAGRAGRDSPGRAYRLYTAADMNTRPLHQTPEILRCPLASTVLWMIAVGIEPNTFPLISPPPEVSVQASLTLLQQLGAIDNSSPPKLTTLGKRMSAFPIDPKYSKVLLSANDYECLDEALSIVAVLSSENIFHSAIHKREEALKAKQKFISPLGDHITLLNVFKAFTKASLKKQWCKENYLHHRNLLYASEVRQQLATLCQRFHMQPSSCGAATQQVLRCLLSGMFVQCAWVRGAGGAGGGAARYVTAGGAAAALHPASVLHATRPPPPALLYTELLTTHRTYMSCVSSVEPAWLHQAAPEFARKCRAPHL